MKKMVERARELSRTVVGTLRRAIDPPIDAAATPLDIRHAVLEAVERRVQNVSHGRRVLPDRQVRVKILAADAAEERALRHALDGLSDAAGARLRELRCQTPAGFRVDVVYLRTRPGSWEPAQRIAVQYLGEPPPSADVGSAAVPPLRISVVAGTTGRSSYSFAAPVVRIGRSESLVDGRGSVRRNDVAFLENDDERNRTVTRGHAEIRYDRGRGEYRVFDEGSANGTRIIRGGEVIEVPPRDPLGVALRTGDELQFGTAAVRVAFAARGT